MTEKTWQLSDRQILRVNRALNGISHVQLRFVGRDPLVEGQFVDLLLAIGVSLQTSHLEQMAPAPIEPISFRFAKDAATMTVDLERLPAAA